MKHFCRASCVFFAAAVATFAQQGGQEEEIITDFGTDEYIYVPNMTLNIGVRTVSGAKTAFSGRGNLLSAQDYGAQTATGVNRIYHDGYVRTDTRTVLDSNGNPGFISPDGKTNSWGYFDDAQLADGLVAMHAYSAAVSDTTVRRGDLGNTYGVEMTLTRDMGKLFKSRANWGLVAGVSMSDLNASMSELVPVTVTTVTDMFSLDGQTPPPAQYFGPTSIATTVADANGNVLTQNIDTTTLLSSELLDRKTTVTTDPTGARNHWKLKGAFLTFRFGPTVVIPITEHFNASFSVGAALVYAGSTYTVVQSYKPATSDDIVDVVSDGVSEFLPGYYVDANLNYTITENAGAYVGASYQGSGAYTQNISSASSAYATNIDLNRLQGLRAGMTFRF